ncbi:hypothetical protein Tco_0169684 [Tanacetum coccineum]
MEELIQAPLDGVGDAIVVPPVLASQFELKIGLLNFVTAISFDGFQNDDPNSHIRRYILVLSSVNAACAQLQLLSDYYCWKDYADREGIKIDWRTRILMKIINDGLNSTKENIMVLEQTYPPTTAGEKLARKNELKAREWKTHTLIWRNKHDLDTLSMDDLYNNMKIYETEVKGSSSSSSNQNSQNVAFVSSNNFGSSNQACGSNSANTDSTSDAIDTDDLEEIDLKWQMAMLTMRARRFLNKTGRKINANGSETIRFNKSKVECNNYHKKGHFTKECRALREKRNREPVSRNVTVETTETKALVAQDGHGFECIYFVLKHVLKSYETLKEHYDNLTKDLNKSQLNVGAYKAGLESVEARLDVYKKNEAVFEEDIKILKLDIMLRDNALTELRKKFEKAEKERDDLKHTLEKFENSSKNLSKLLDSQMNDKYKLGEGYHVVPPPYTGNFMPPKPDLVLADMDEYVFSKSVTSAPAIATSKVKTSESKPKSISEPLIEDWISDSENENEIEFKSR